MKGEPIDKLVHGQMFPRPKSSDPPNFHALLQRNLIPEVRLETQSFYGHLDTQEAKYPGLDYSHPTHRIRLSRFPWHRRLFRAFDSLRLTEFEIAALTKWEGTKWAKEKFEKEQGVKIRDTTSDGFPDWVEPEDRPAEPQTTHAHAAASRSPQTVDEDEDEDMEQEEEEEGEESDEEVTSVGEELNERLRAQAARRNAGDTTAVLDAEWEQWLKNAIESGDLPWPIDPEASSEALEHITGLGNVVPAALFPPEMLSAARGGNWSEIPESLHPLLRHTLEAESPRRPRTRPRSVEQLRPRTGASSRWAYYGFHVPTGESDAAPPATRARASGA